MRARFPVGLSLALLLALAFVPLGARAAQSPNFTLEETGPGNAAGVQHGSDSYRMQGDLSWRQEAPLTGQSFRITNTPPASSSSSSAATSASSASVDNGDGGGRGNGTTTTNPPSSRSSSASSAPASVPSSSSSSAPSEASASSASSDESSASTASSVSSEGTHGAASSDASSAPGTRCVGFLCPDQFWRPIDLVPVPDEEPAGSGAVLPLPERFAGAVQACVREPMSIFLLFFSFLLGSFTTMVTMFFGVGTSALRRALFCALVAGAATCIVSLLWVDTVSAAVSSPQRHVYNGHLLNASGAPVTTPHSIRFSQWYHRDMQASDVVAGVINTGAATYAGYQEVFTVTPDSQGYFSVILGTGATLPDLAAMDASDLDNLFLQVEVKAAAAADTAYETLDVNPSDPLVDRSPILSVPFAQNADLLDQRGLGTGSGSIPYLGSGGLLPVATVPGGTNADSFVIDANDTSAAGPVLRFGTALAETLAYDVADDTFVFSADLEVQGDLVVTGLINGIDISAIAGSDDGKLRVSSGAGLTINVTGGAYRINGDVTDYTGASAVAVQANATNYVFIGSGGLAVRASGYPDDESFIRLATVVTDGAGVTQVNDHRVVQSDDREEAAEVAMHAEFPNASYQADAVDNVGQLSVQLDNATFRNFYQWTSTRTTLQDYDVAVRVSLPADFVRWDAAPLAVSYRTTSASAADSKLDVSVFDTNGVAVTLGGGATGLASTSWATAALTYGNGATWTAGQEFLLRFKLSAKDGYQSHLGSLKLRYVRLTP